VFYSLGAANSLAGNSEQAIEWWKKTRKDFPTTDSGQRALFGLGAEFFQLKNWKEAERHFEEWLDRDGVEESPAYPEAMLRLSECKERLGNVDEALRMLLVLTEIPSSSPVREEALVAAARLAFQLEDKKTFDRLASRMDAEVKSPSARMGWHLTSGNRHYKEKRWKEAIRDYEAALEASKQVQETDPAGLETTVNQLRIRLGWCLLATREWEKAETCLRPVTGDAAQTDEYRYLMAETLRQLEKWKESLDLFAKIPESSEYRNDSRPGEADAAYHVGDWEKASILYGSLAKETPKSPERVFFLLRAADSEQKLRRWAAGAELCAAAAVETASSAIRERALYLEGWCRIRGEDFSGTVKALTALTEEFPKSERVPESLYMLGQASGRIGNPTQECEVLERLVNEFPDSKWRSDGLLRLAGAYSACGKREGIRSALLRFQEGYPDLPLHENYALWLAEELVDSGSYGAGLKPLDSLLSRELGAEDLEKSLYLAGVCHLNLGDWEKATGFFKRVMEEFPDGRYILGCRFGLGRSAKERGKTDEAWEQVHAAMERMTEKPSFEPVVEAQVYLLAGDLSFDKGDYEAAYRSYARPSLLYRHPKWTPLALQKSALAKEKMGDTEKAQSLRDELRAAYPDFQGDKGP
jgi:TolA-binding protein